MNTQPIAWCSGPIAWADHQSETVCKLTREPQVEHGFDTPLFIGVPFSSNLPVIEELLATLRKIEEYVPPYGGTNWRKAQEAVDKMITEVRALARSAIDKAEGK